MTVNENTLVPSNIELVIRSMIMVFMLPFGEVTAWSAVLRRLTPHENGNKPELIQALEALQLYVADYRAEIVPRFANAPLNQENVNALIEIVEDRLDDCMKRLAGTDVLGLRLTDRDIAVTIQDCEDAIDDLRNAYEVPDTEPLEAVRDKLQTWLDEMDRQHVPHPSYPEGPV